MSSLHLYSVLLAERTGLALKERHGPINLFFLFVLQTLSFQGSASKSKSYTLICSQNFHLLSGFSLARRGQTDYPAYTEVEMNDDNVFYCLTG